MIIKIGILIKDFEKLDNWERRIIEEIKNNSSLELSLLIKEGRTHVTAPQDKNVIGRFLFETQKKIEAKVYKRQCFTVNKDEIVPFLNGIECIKLSPKRQGCLDIFSQEDAKIVKAYHLDIILQHEFTLIRGDILNAAKYGIWRFHHTDTSIIRGVPAGFWEIILKQPVIGVTLQKLTSEMDSVLVIDKGFYNCYWSYNKNNINILEGSVDILFKNIRLLQQNRLKLEKSTVYYNRLYSTPSLYFAVKYLFKFYPHFIAKQVRKVLQTIFGIRYECWTLFIGKGHILESALFRLKPLKLPKHEFWADPFLFKYEDEYYVFFEKYSYQTEKGKISCGKVVNNQVIDVVDVLDLDYHLSYPFIFSEDNDIYMIPETSQNKRVEVYRCVDFPKKWERYATAFEGEAISDTTYYKDELSQRWLFLNKGFQDDCTNLFIYKIDSLKMDNIQSHACNPVIIDSRVARNAGQLFEYEDKIIRPSQNNSNGIYGYGLNLNVIKKLTLDEYIEEKLVTVEPYFHKGLMGTHHLHQLDDIFVIDGAYGWK